MINLTATLQGAETEVFLLFPAASVRARRNGKTIVDEPLNPAPFDIAALTPIDAYGTGCPPHKRV